MPTIIADRRTKGTPDRDRETDLSQTAAPFIDPVVFPSTPINYFWSSSVVAGSGAPPSYAWSVDFTYGNSYGGDVSSTYNVRCVR
jgi:hypothetical protein